MPAGPERTVRLEGDVALLAGLEQRSPVLERAELHLVDGRRDRGDVEQRVQFAHVEVGDADGPGVAQLAGAFHAWPGPGGTTLGPVDDVQVDVVDTEPLEALLGFGRRIPVGRIELGRDEHLVARHATLAQPPSDALLVAVGLGGVDVPVPELECPSPGVDAFRTVGHLPDAEAKHRHLVAVREHASAPVCRWWTVPCR